MPVLWKETAYSHGVASTIASVIQGEASSPEGQFAVASVMLNRLKHGGFGKSLQTVITPSQFNGFARAEKSASVLAVAVMTGTLDRYGETGNALFYASPSPLNAGWANSHSKAGEEFFAHAHDIDGNYFSDRLGPPSDAFNPPRAKL